jgi:hypothetical protein
VTAARRSSILAGASSVPELAREEERPPLLERQRQMLGPVGREPGLPLVELQAGGEQREARRLDPPGQRRRGGEGDFVPAVCECARQRHERVKVRVAGAEAEEDPEAHAPTIADARRSSRLSRAASAS